MLMHNIASKADELRERIEVGICRLRGKTNLTTERRKQQPWLSLLVALATLVFGC